MTMLVESAGAGGAVKSAAGRSAAHRRTTVALEVAGLHFPAEMEFIRRMRSLVHWAGPGRPVTQTGAMRRGDTLAWVRHLGLRAASGGWCPPSMWDIRGIGQPWDIAIETGMLTLTS